jgi:segregation and condensation protein A
VAVGIRFGEAHRPEEATHVTLGSFDGQDSFDGPLALLLSLIEARQLDVLTVRLGDLAGAYLDALARLEAGRLPMLSAFVTVCSQLILIKSRALLPRARAEAAMTLDEGHDPEAELRQRLILYRRYRDAALALGDRLALGGLFHREPGTASARLVPPPAPVPQQIGRAVTLEERAQVIRTALRRAPRIVLQDLLRNVTDRVVVAVTFLALLELAKGRQVVIEQAEPWGPIHVRPVEAGTGTGR